jgi:hypothetical protein
VNQQVMLDKSIKSFQDFNAWKLARELRIQTYVLAGALPDEKRYAEVYDLTLNAIRTLDGYIRYLNS